MIKLYKFKTSNFNRTFDTYDYVHCYNYMNIHDIIKLYKHGYSKVTDHACREIRFNRINRADALSLIKKHELQKPLYLDLFCDWLGIKKSINYLFDRIKNPYFWPKKDVAKFKINILSSKIPSKKINKKEN